MGRVNYTVSAFNSTLAASGKLCVMVKSTFTETLPATLEDDSQYFGGVGICIPTGSNEYTLIYNGVTYVFNYKGKPANAAARDAGSSATWVLLMGEAQVTYSDVGSSISSNNSSGETRGSWTDPQYDATYDTVKIVDNMSPRDQFAAQALRGLLAHVDNPAAISRSEMNFYCNAAYDWASNMMTAAANARPNTYNDGGSSSSSSEAEVGTLDSNTEKLLNNIIYALERTDTVSSEGVWSKSGETNVVGQHTDAWVSTHALGSTTYQNVAAAETAGWVWIANFYAERIAAPDLVTALEAVRNSIRNNDSSDANTIIKKLDAIATAINNSGGGGGGGGSSTVTLSSSSETGIKFFGGPGATSSNPFYISGGGFPTRAAISGEFSDTDIHDFLTFNAAGAVGYSRNSYVATAIVASIANNIGIASDLYDALENYIDTRIRAWLQGMTVTYNGQSCTVNIVSPS